MTGRKEIFDLLKTTRELDVSTRGKIREEWDLGLMMEALNILDEEYERLMERYGVRGCDSFDYRMFILLHNKLLGIDQLKNILKYACGEEIFPEIKRPLVGIIVEYYHFIEGHIKEDGEATA